MATKKGKQSPITKRTIVKRNAVFTKAPKPQANTVNPTIRGRRQ